MIQQEGITAEWIRETTNKLRNEGLEDQRAVKHKVEQTQEIQSGSILLVVSDMHIEIYKNVILRFHFSRF